MAGLRKLKGKYYARIWYKENGKRKEKLIPLGTKDKQRAKEELLPEIEKQEEAFKKGIISSIDAIEAKPPSNLEKKIDAFYKHLKVTDRSEETIELYRLALDTFTDIYEDRSIEYLTSEDYTDFLSKMRERYPNNNTCNIRLKCIRAFLNWLKETGRIDRIPFKIKKLPTKKKKPRYFSDQEMEKKILEEAKDHDGFYARIWVHWKTGLRLGELHDSYLENGFIKTYDPEKHGIERSIPVDKETEKQYKIAKEWDVVDDSVSRKFRKLLRKLDLYETKHGDTRHFHNLRDTFAVRTYYESRDIYRVRVLLGHASVKTTEKYANFDLSMLEKDFDIEDNQQNSRENQESDRTSSIGDFSTDRNSKRMFGLS